MLDLNNNEIIYDIRNFKIQCQGNPKYKNSFENQINFEKSIIQNNQIVPKPKLYLKTNTKVNNYINLIEDCEKRNYPKEKSPEIEKKFSTIFEYNNFKIHILENNNKKTYSIDETLIRAITVKEINNNIIALVEKMNNNVEKNIVYIPTYELRRKNPWILLEFYETKLIFT